MLNQQDLTGLFQREFALHLGTVCTPHLRTSHIRMLVRKLTAHLDAIGWPDTEQEALIYVRQAVDRYC